MKKCIAVILAVIMLASIFAENSRVKMVTSLGEIEIELFDQEAPKTVENFLAYVDEGYYSNTVFHRVIDNFMIQGGGFTKEGKQKPTKPPVVNESDNGLSNTVGTIAMARTSYPHSATSQFFINVKDNTYLDNQPSRPGYCVFGKVIKGMEVVNKIKATETGKKHGMPDWPIRNVVIKSVTIIGE